MSKARLKINAALKFTNKRSDLMTLGNKPLPKHGRTTLLSAWQSTYAIAKKENEKKSASVGKGSKLQQKLLIQGGRATGIKSISKTNLPYKRGDIAALYRLFESKTNASKKQAIIPTKKGIALYGRDTFFERIKVGQKIIGHGERKVVIKGFTAYIPHDISKQIANIRQLERQWAAGRANKAILRNVLRATYMQCPRTSSTNLLAFRRNLTIKMQVAIREGMFQAQIQFLDELKDSKMVNWRNLTGNAYTGLVTMMYLRLSGNEESRLRSLAEHEGKRRRATRTKISPNRYRVQRRDGNSKNPTSRGVFHGIRYDSVNGAVNERWFSIKDRGQFVATKATYAYDEAKQILNQASHKLPTSRGSYASLRMASGAEYLHVISPDFMSQASKLMRTMVRKNIGKYLKHPIR